MQNHEQQNIKDVPDMGLEEAIWYAHKIHERFGDGAIDVEELEGFINNMQPDC